VKPRALASRGKPMMRRAPRRGAIVFENNIRELQTSVDGPGSPPERSHAYRSSSATRWTPRERRRPSSPGSLLE
jgi:hypothetical protein